MPKAPAIVLSEADWIAIEREACQRSLSEFIRRSWSIIEPSTPLFWWWHLDVISEYSQAYHERRLKQTRLIINVPPGCCKSAIFSVLAPAWAWTRWPERRYINITNELGLATRDCRRMRDVVTSEWYQKLWGDKVILSPDQQEKTNYANTKNGFRIGLGFNSGITGKRGTDILIDDPIDAELAFSDIETQNVNDKYDNAISTRLNDVRTDGIGIIMQRTRENDLSGHVQELKSEYWTKVIIPMEYEGQPCYDPVKDLGPEYAWLIDPRKKIGELMCPERFPQSYVDIQKQRFGSFGTASQFQQRPSPLTGGIIKKNYWTAWPKDKPIPRCNLIFSSWDTAFTEKDYKDAAFSAKTTWGVFDDEQTGRPAMIVLGKWWGRVEYPELKKAVKKDFKDMNCDYTLIEKKASGISLYQDVRRMRGIVLRPFDPGQLDKIARAHRATPNMEAGLVYYPEGKQWAIDLIDIVAKFPTGAPPCKDITDTVSQAVIWVREKGWTKPPDDDHIPDPKHDLSEEEEEDKPKGKESAYG